MRTKTISPYDISRFKGDTELCGKSSGTSPDEMTDQAAMHGLYVMPDGTMAKYTLTKQPPASRYVTRGAVSLLDLRTNCILKVKVPKEKVRSRPNAESPSAETAEGDSPRHSREMVYKEARKLLNLYTDDPEELRKEIAKAAAALHNEHILLLTSAADKSCAVSEMPFSLIVALHKDRYLNSRSKSDKAKHDRLLRLEKVATYMGNRAISKVSLAEVERICEEIGVTWSDYILEAKAFLNFVFALRPNREPYNPFQEYLDRHSPNGSKKQESKKNQKRAATSDILSTHEERKLNELILSHPENGSYVGISLVKDAGFSATEACAVKWEDVYPLEGYPDTVLIRYRRDTIAGAVHDYTFPVVGIGARVLLQRRKHLQDMGISLDKLGPKSVVTEADALKALPASKLTQICRNLLQKMQDGYARLAQFKDLESGAGVELLQNTYLNRLNEHCGLRSDPAMVDFLRHRALNGMLQANHYRAFTDHTALYFMYHAMRRDKRFEAAVENKKPVKRKKKGAGEEITVQAPHSHYRTETVCLVAVNPGDVVTIRCPTGCAVSVKAKRLTTSCSESV